MTLIWIQNGQQDKENDRLEKIWYYVSRKDDITDLAQTLFISVLQGELFLKFYLFEGRGWHSLRVEEEHCGDDISLINLFVKDSKFLQAH